MSRNNITLKKAVWSIYEDKDNRFLDENGTFEQAIINSLGAEEQRMSTKIDAKKEGLIDAELMSEDLLRQWLEQQTFLSEEDKNTLFEMACAYLNDVTVLYQVNKALRKKEASFSAEENKLMLKINQDNDQCTLFFDEEKLESELA